MKAKANKAQLTTDLCSKRLKPSETIESFIDSFASIFAKLDSMNLPIEEDTQVTMLLASLSFEKQYESLITALKTISDDLDWGSASARLIEETMSKNSKKPSSGGPKLGSAAGAGHRNGGGGGGKAKKAKRELNCFICKGPRKSSDCPHAKKLRESLKLGRGDGSSSKAPKNPKLGFVALKNGSQHAKSEELALDSGCSHHMLSKKSWLKDMEATPEEEIKLAKKGEISLRKSKGVIDIDACSMDGANAWARLAEALHAPDLDANLASAWGLAKKGIKSQSDHPSGWLYDDSGAFGVTDAVDGMRKMRADPRIYGNSEGSAVALKAQRKEKEALDLWHERMGHLSKRALRKMIGSGAAEGISLDLKVKDNDICGPRQFGKQHRESFARHFDNSIAVGDSIHSDACGPLSTISYGGAKCFAAFIDQGSRFAAVAPIRRKNEALDEFATYRSWLEAQYDVKIKRLHSDNGGEHDGMMEFLDANGMECARAAPCAPEQNGVAERLNRALIEMARSMLKNAGLSLRLWVEALWLAADVKNFSITKAIGDIAPIEKLTKKKPSADHLRVFGCLAHMHAPKEKRKKLLDKAKEGMLLRCLPHGIYKAHAPEDNSAHIAHDAAFDENALPGKKGNMGRNIQLKESEEDPEEPTASINLSGSDDPSENIARLIAQPPDLDTVAESEDEDAEVIDHTNATEEENLGARRSSRISRKPSRLAYHAIAPKSYVDPAPCSEAMPSPYSKKWAVAVDEELSALNASQAWDLAELPKGRRALGSKFAFKVKEAR